MDCQKRNECVLLSTNAIGIKILKIEGEEGRYFCWRRDKLKDKLLCVLIKCNNDETVKKFCEENDLRDIYSFSQKEGLFVVVNICAKSERSLMKAIGIFLGHISKNGHRRNEEVPSGRVDYNPPRIIIPNKKHR